MPNIFYGQTEIVRYQKERKANLSQPQHLLVSLENPGMAASRTDFILFWILCFVVCTTFDTLSETVTINNVVPGCS